MFHIEMALTGQVLLGSIFEHVGMTDVSHKVCGTGTRESVKLKGSVKKGKQEPKNHHQSQHSPNSHALFATDSLELKLAYTAFNEHTNTHKRQIFRN